MIRALKTRVFLLYLSEIGSRLLGTQDYSQIPIHVLFYLFKNVWH